MRETFVHVSSCEDKEDSLEEDNHVVPLVLANLLQDIHPYKAEDEPDMLIASCENSETSSHDAPCFPTAKESNGTVLSATFTEGESSFDVLNSSTNHAFIDQLLVEPSLDLSLSHDDLLDIPYDNDELCDNAYVLQDLEPNTCAEINHIIHIASTDDELKL